METMDMSIINRTFWKNRRVLITGHTGFKGAWLTSLLLNLGADITGYSLSPCESPNLYEILGLSSEMDSIYGDIRDSTLLHSVVMKSKPEVVFHLAAQPLVRQSYINPALTFETNIMGTVNLLECLRTIPISRSFINVTTDKVYENKDWVWGYRENDTLNGYDPYSNSKSCSELVTSSYRSSFFQAADSCAISTARSGNVIGGGDFANDRIIPDCVRASAFKQVINVRNPNSIRPYQHVLDCLMGYLVLAEKQYFDKGRYEGSYNFGPNESDCLSTGTLVNLFCNEWGSNAKWISTSKEGPHESITLKLDCSKARTLLGWNPVFSLDDSIKLVVEWYKAYYHGEDCKTITHKQVSNLIARF